MDSLSHLLANKDFDEPAETRAIKQYVRDKFHVEVGVQLQGKDIIILASSAALVGRLRYDTQNLKRAANTDQRIIFRITN